VKAVTREDVPSKRHFHLSGWGAMVRAMALSTALPRLFLATILMLNGIASAMAGVQHAAVPGKPHGIAEETGQVDPAGGHAHGCAEEEMGLAGTDVPATGGSNGAGHPSSPDCCESGVCQCACANTGPPALPPDGRNGFSAHGQTCTWPMASWHVAPALPHLMRPPIG